MPGQNISFFSDCKVNMIPSSGEVGHNISVTSRSIVVSARCKLRTEMQAEGVDLHSKHMTIPLFNY